MNIQKSAGEQIALQQSLARKAEIALEKVVNRGDWDLAGLNLRLWFQFAQYCTLTAWRANDDRAVMFLQETLRAADRARDLLCKNIEQGAIPSAFSFEAASVLETLCSPVGATVKPPPILYSQITPFSDRKLSYLLFERISGLPPSADWNKAIASLASNKRATLAVKTYVAYGNLVEAAQHGDIERASNEALSASRLFSQRASDSYYCGGPATAGGGPANGFVVDYELAALQRRFFQAPARGAELHWWHW